MAVSGSSSSRKTTTNVAITGTYSGIEQDDPIYITDSNHTHQSDFDLVNEWYPDKGYLSDEQFWQKPNKLRILRLSGSRVGLDYLSAMKERRYLIVTTKLVSVLFGHVQDATRSSRRVNQLIAKRSAKLVGLWTVAQQSQK